jgi:hypothetical protein
MGYSGAGGETDSWKKQKQKISWHCPFNDRKYRNDIQYFHLRILTIKNMKLWSRASVASYDNSYPFQFNIYNINNGIFQRIFELFWWKGGQLTFSSRHL